MFLLAARIGLAMISGETQADRLSEHERVIWSQIRPSIVTLYQSDRPTGVAALIDDSGYFVTHASSLASQSVSGRSVDGRNVTFVIINRDGPSQLVLLKADNWPAGLAHPLRAPRLDEGVESSLLAVLPSGPIRAAYVSKRKLGLLKPSRRLVPLAEIRFEASPQAVGGALIISDSGEFIGSLNATLEHADGQQGSFNGTLNNGFVGSQSQQNQAIPTPGPNKVYIQPSGPGPAEMTVAYTVGPEVVQHALQGFLSPSHASDYAALGVFCTDAIGGGAQIQRVTPGSPAQEARLRPGDIMLQINYTEIPDQVAFASAMLQQKVGKKITLTIKRGKATLLVDIVPAKAAD